MEQNAKEYKLIVDPRILKILSENLYTNLYYVISELVANAYDADAHNVYIEIGEDYLFVEDDGFGMNDSTIKDYLVVGLESRTEEANSYTPSGRRKMGRKGVGKLAALSIAKDYRLMTKQNNQFNGFIVTKDIDEFGTLQAIDVSNQNFIYTKDKTNGTRIEIVNCEVNIHKDINVIAKNILKMFPIVSEKFKIHIKYNNKEKTIDDFDKEIISQLATLMIIGDDFEEMKNQFISSEGEIVFKEKKEQISDTITMITKTNQNKEISVCIKGWIGSYKTTKGRTKLISDFPDNHISIFANGKLGEFNVLPNITTTRMTEQYIVGNLYIDCFEDSDLPDMSLSNRQGYNTNDKRYIVAMEMVKSLLTEALALHDSYIDLKENEKNKLKMQKELEDERQLRIEMDKFNSNIKEEIKKVSKNKIIEENVDKILEDSKKIIQLKNKIKNQKKKILISHTGKDKPVADIAYEMLLVNGFDKEEIIYTNSDYEESRIIGGPFGYKIWDYLKEFFVQSYVEQGIYVLFIHSSNMKNSWGAIVEVGAEWITRSSEKQHCILNISNEEINEPLRDGGIYISVNRNGKSGDLSCYRQEADTFCQIIEDIAKYFGKINLPRDKNISILNKLLKVK